MAINQLIATGIRPPEIMSPYELVQGANVIRAGQMENQLTQRKMGAQNALTGLMQQYGGDAARVRQGLIEQGYGDQAMDYETKQAEAQKSQLEMAIKKTEYAAQILSPFVDQPATPEIDARYRQAKAHLEQTFGQPMTSLPDSYDPQSIKAGYMQGMKVHAQLQDQYQAISAVGGYQVFNKSTGQFARPQGKPIFAPNASPELQQAIVRGKEAEKGVKAIGPGGEEFYTPQGSLGNNFGNIRSQGASAGFQSFSTPEEGLSAIDQNLQAYGSKGINTLAGVISRWAPPNENDTQRLIKEAAGRLGIDPNQPIDLNHPAVRQAVGTAIMYQEQGARGIFGQGGVKGPTIAQKNQAEIDKQGQVEQVKTQAELGKQQQIKIRDSKEALNLLGNIERLLPESTGSGIGAQADSAAAYFGSSTKGAKAISALATNAKKLVMMMPRGAGPQSDRDVALAEQMAGDLSNPNLPVETRQAAAAELKRITSQYIPGAELTPGYQPQQNKVQQQAGAITKTLNGKTYTKINGEWHEAD